MESNGNHCEKTVISASRRTDVPAFYMPQFMEVVRRGYFSVKNPFSGTTRVASAKPDYVHSIVFWSKDYTRFLSKEYGERLMDMGYRLFFQFTVNSHVLILEPGLPQLVRRLKQFRQLGELHSPEAVTWRFDPVCFFRQADTNGNMHDNLGEFETIARVAADAGITRCITSFTDLYGKVMKRLAKHDELKLSDPSLERKREVLARMAEKLFKLNIALFTCCEKELISGPDAVTGVSPSACIDHDLLMKLYGPGLSRKRDRGQRASKGCQCQESFDVGDYTAHPCYHRCLYCYANPAPEIAPV
ncbi:MAG: DUF1848 family protein [Thermodesulfobacteriota bacterium]